MSDPAAPARVARPWGRWALNLLLVGAAFAGVQWWQTRPLASGSAPPLIGHSTSGQPVSLAQQRGRPVLVYFWASWCPVCRAEGPTIDALAKDFTVLSVAMQSGGADAVRAYLAEQGLGFAAVPDPRGEIAGDWGVTAVPAAFVVDAEGRIRFSTVGYTTGPGLRARLWAAQRLQPFSDGRESL